MVKYYKAYNMFQTIKGKTKLKLIFNLINQDFEHYFNDFFISSECTAYNNAKIYSICIFS